MKLGQRLKQLRNACGLTLDDAAHVEQQDKTVKEYLNVISLEAIG